MIKIRGLKKEYPDFCLGIESLDIEDGGRVALVGSNGSGKSTLLKILAGVLAPDSGSVEFSSGCRPFWSPQDAYCFNTTVLKNVLLGTDAKLSRPEREQAARRALADTGMAEFARKRASRLSGGETQRMIFARILAAKRKCLLLDEPLSAVDVERSRQMEDLLLEYCAANGTTLLMATHVPAQAVRVSTNIIVMNKGKIEECGETDAVLHTPKSDWTKLFLEQWRIGK